MRLKTRYVESTEEDKLECRGVNMDESQRHSDDDAKADTPSDVTCCQTSQLAIPVAISLATIILVKGLLLTLVLLIMRAAAPEMSQTTKSSVEDRLQQCQQDYHDLTLMLNTVTQDPRCGVCPQEWLWWRSHCYFFSVGLEENLQWDDSAEFCQQNNGSLAVIKDLKEMEFLQGVMKMFPKFPFLWVGLTDAKEEGQWVWWDETDIQHYISVRVEWDSEHRDCADLRGGGRLFAADCEAYGPWVCKRES